MMMNDSDQNEYEMKHRSLVIAGGISPEIA